MKKSSKNKEVLDDEDEDSSGDEDFLTEEDEKSMKERLRDLGYL